MIDLGTTPTGHTLPGAALGVNEMDFLVEELAIAEIPVVLNVFPRFDDAAARDRALTDGRGALHSAGLLPRGHVHEDLEQWLRVLEQPHYYVSVRVFEVSSGRVGPANRICLASDERTTVLAVRRDDVLTIEPVLGDPARTLARSIGPATPFDPGSINAQTDLLAEALDAAPSDVGATAARLRGIGIADDRAATLAAAMATCAGRTEITAVVRRHGTRHAAGRPVAVFDTRPGRIVATSTVAADGRAWSSLAAGTERKLATAVGELIASARTVDH